MTVNIETPLIVYAANGVATEFPFSWSSVAANEINVLVDGIRQQIDVQYRLTNYTFEEGGTVEFMEAPEAGFEVRIYRETPVTQQLDYVDGNAFPAETHEAQMDKDTRILQEIISGQRGDSSRPDLLAVQKRTSVEIQNTAGAGAEILPWECTGLFAGVFTGAIVDVAPANGSGTNRPDGFVWFELEEGAPPPASGIIYPESSASYNPVIPQFGDSIFRISHDLFGQVEGIADSAFQHWIDGEVVDNEPYVQGQVTGLQQFWYRITISSGTSPEVRTTSERPFGIWHDAYLGATDGDELTFFTAESKTAGSFVIFFMNIAPDTGSGEPDLNQITSRTVAVTFQPPESS